MTNQKADSRHVVHGSIIPSVTYSDQPYIVKSGDGAWVCVMTTGAGREGEGGQHIITQRSPDQGRTWTDRVEVESPNGPEASWAVLAKGPNGRLYCFYTYNADNLRRIETVDPGFSQAEVKASNGGGQYGDGYCRRVDSLGAYVFKISDDHGRSWSDERWTIPVREFDIDTENVTGGKVRFFWNVGRPFGSGKSLFLPIHKVGNFGYGFFTRSEGALLRSDDLFTSRDPGTAHWETLPEGRIGLRAPDGGGPIAEEHSFCELSDGGFFCVYRTVAGYPAAAYSRDRGRTWSNPDYLRRSDGRPFKNPRAANFVWRCGNGKYLYWFHNNGGPCVLEHHAVDAGYPYQSPRNPIWMCGGSETDGPDGRVIDWSEPEIVLYDDDPYIRMSYPDLVEDGGRYFVTETNKHLARVHELDRNQLESMWRSAAGEPVPTPPPCLDIGSSAGDALMAPLSVPMPPVRPFLVRDGDRFDYGSKDLRGGFAVEIEFFLDDLDSGQVLLDSRDRWGRGLTLGTSIERTLTIRISDGETLASWDTDPGAVLPGRRHNLVIAVDGGPKIITFILDGRLLDGGETRQFGWGRFSYFLKSAAGDGELRIGPLVRGAIYKVRMYDRILTANQAAGRRRSVER